MNAVGRHSENCRPDLCCRCQSRPSSVEVRGESLCGYCSSCCQTCGRPPSGRLLGLVDGVCGRCRGRCDRCGTVLDGELLCTVRCAEQRPGPGHDPVGFVLRSLPGPLWHALQGRMPAEALGQVQEQLRWMHATRLADRIGRRWHQQWAHALQEKEPGTRHMRWSPDEVALRLVAPSDCSDPDCEDGLNWVTDRSCERCTWPENRFNPALPPPAEHAHEALADMRAVLRASGRSVPGTRKPWLQVEPPSAEQVAAKDAALQRARERLRHAGAGRLREPEGSFLGVEEQLAVQRDETVEHDRDAVYRAAVARARTEKPGRRKR